MLFTLEALSAKHGDSLLLHFGTRKKPQLVVIDGGPGGVYTKTLEPRLNELKKARAPNGRLPIRMVMVSHIDDDHINGILRMTNKLVDAGGKPAYDVTTFWHNSFDDLIGNEEEERAASLTAATTASFRGSLPASLHISEGGEVLLASVPQGRDLRLAVEKLGCTVNEGFQNLVMVPQGKKQGLLKLGPALSFTVVGPLEEEVIALQEEWNKVIKKKGLAEIAAFADDSVFNLSSIVVLAKAGDKTMLLTGDARGDNVLRGLKRAGLLKNGKLHVDLLKVPHHGSDRNVETSFFRQVTADHYVISADGKHGNPDTPMLKMLSEARGNDKYTIHLTNLELPEDSNRKRIIKFFEKEKKEGKKYKVLARDPKKLSISVDLGDEKL
ncbi:MAG: hypothetical protein AB7O59_05505 [Pirellulales bacterium]